MNHLGTVMKTRISYCLLAATVLIAVALCVRQRTLNELRASNQLLRDQLDSQVPTFAAGPAPADQSTNPVAALSQDEHAELLRLRGQFLPLRRELQEMSNRIATLAQPSPPRMPANYRQTEADRKAEIVAMNEFMRSDAYRSARNLNIALGEYVKTHGGELPGDLAQIEAFARNSLPQGFSQRFELMRTGTISKEALSYTLVAREKEPQQSADGKWRRLYLGADGGTSSANMGPVTKPTSKDWKAWELNNEKLMKMMATGKKEKT